MIPLRDASRSSVRGDSCCSTSSEELPLRLRRSRSTRRRPWRRHFRDGHCASVRAKGGADARAAVVTPSIQMATLPHADVS